MLKAVDLVEDKKNSTDFFYPKLCQVYPYNGLMGRCGLPGYVFWEVCLKKGFKFIIFCLNQGIGLSSLLLNRISFLGR